MTTHTTGLGGISAVGAATTWLVLNAFPRYSDSESDQYVEEISYS